MTESSVLLDQLVVCGESDYQKVIIGLDGTETGIRRNITATLELFDGISLERLSASTSTSGVVLIDSTMRSRPIFSIPDMDATDLSEVMIGFTVQADCGVVAAIESNNELLVFDTWILNYEIDGIPFTESYEGVEYKNTISTPNLALEVDVLPTVDMGTPFQRTVRIVNSGLNSYLDRFQYEVTLEPGLVYESAKIGDATLPFTKSTNAQGDTIISATISNRFFTNNTAESGLIGDGNGRFNVDEVVIITETIFVANCGGDDNFNLNTNQIISWGCGEENCQQATTANMITFGIGEEQIEFQVGIDTITPGFCSEGTASLIISNNGFEFDDGFGTIKDITTGIGFANGDNFLLGENGYEVTAIQIGEVVVFFADTLTSLNENDIFTIDPDGPGGLEDVDGDGFFDDLRVGESFTITATYQLDCSYGETFNAAEECDNDFIGNFDGKIIYTNPCGTTSEQNISNFLRSFNSGSTKEVCADPDAFNDEDQFTIVYTGERRQGNFSSCSSSDEVRVSVTLPDGITIDTSSFLEQDSAISISVLEQTGNDWMLTFDAEQINLNTDYNLNLVFNTNCTEAGFTSFPTSIEYYCPECDCAQLWYCGVLEGTFLHNNGMPCREVVCETGISVTSFEANRSTFGYVDEAFTIPFNPADANTKVALGCDSVVMDIETVVGDATLIDSLGLVISYGNANEEVSNIPTFLFGRGTVTVIDADGNSISCELNENKVSLDTSTSLLRLFLDFQDCLDGRPLAKGSQINFKGYFSINPDGPIPNNTFKKVPGFRANAYAIVDGQLYENCESYGQLFRLAKLETTLSGPNNDSYPEGCAGTSMVYSLDKSLNKNALQEFLGNELRSATKINKVEITYDPSLLTAFSDWGAEFKTQDGEWTALPDFDQFEVGTYEAVFDENTAISSMSGSNQLFQLRINAVPECGSAFSGANGSASYAITTALEYTDRYYANYTDGDNCSSLERAVEERNIIYENPPSFSLEGIDQEVSTASNEVQWIIEHCNTSFNADAGATWIAFEMPSDSIEITTIELLSQSGTVDTLLVNSYDTTANKVFAFTPGLSRNIRGNLQDDVCNLIRVTASLKFCGTESITASAGWNCLEYAADWTPDLYAPCSERNINLSVTTLLPFLSSDFLAESSLISGSLCDTSTIDIVVRNEASGIIYDVNSQITLPIGTKLVPGSVSFAFPSTAEFQTVSTDPVFVETDTALGNIYEYVDFAQLHSFLDENGLQGFNVNAPDSSEFRFRYQIVTDCNFNNNEINRYRFQGVAACGLPSNIALAETPPFIFDLNTEAARQFRVELLDQDTIQDGQTNTLFLEVTNIGQNPSIIDSLTISLPTALSYIPNTTLALALVDWDLAEPRLIASTEDGQILRYPLPSNMESEDAVSLSFQVDAAGVDCSELLQIKVSTISKVDFFCAVTEENCLLDFLPSEEQVFSLPCKLPEPTDPCDNFIQTNSDTLLAPSCEDMVSYCLPNLSESDRSTVSIFDNGIPVDLNNLSACNIRQICIYSYGNILDATGSIEVLSWEVDGLTYSGTVASIAVLVDSMNVWDPTGNWSLNEMSVVIEGGHEGGIYGQMDVSSVDTGTRSVLGYDTRFVPMGSGIDLGIGKHDLVIDYGTCQDSFTIDVIGQACNTCIPATIENVIIEKAVCNQETGSILVNITNDLNDYNFEWAPENGIVGSTANVRTNLIAGGYKITIRNKEDEACFIEKFVIVENGNLPDATCSIGPATCIGANGTAVLSPSDFTYLWSDGGNGATRTDLLAGIYYVTFTDPASPDCPNVKLIEIPEINELTASLNVVNYPSCGASNGSVAVNVTGGSGDYAYSFPRGTNEQDGLSPGTYELNIRDEQSGCELLFSFLLESRETVETLTITNTTDITCVEAIDGAVNFEITYSNDFLFPADTIITDGINQYTNGALGAGDYFIYIQDVTGCITSSAPFTINVPTSLDLVIFKSIDCNNPLFIEVEPVDTSLVLRYDWADVAGDDNEPIRTDLTSGVYELSVFDAQNCSTSVSIELPECCEPPVVQNTNITTADCGANNGQVDILIDGTVSNYTFNYTPNLGEQGTTANSRVNLPTGDYLVTISLIEDSSCFDTLRVTVPEETIVSYITDSNITTASCGLANGTVELVVEGDNTLYTYSYEPNEGTVGATPNLRANLPAGTYTVTVALTANPTCEETQTIIVPEDLTATYITGSNITTASCGLANGTVELLVEGDNSLYTYVYEPNEGTAGATPNLRANLPAGTYTVTVALAANPACEETQTIVVTEDLTATYITDSNITTASCGSANGTVELQVTGDPSLYTYSYAPEVGSVGTSPNIQTNVPAGTYTVRVALASNPICGETQTIVVPEDTAVSYITDSNITTASCGLANGAVELIVEGDNTLYNYTYEPNVGTAGTTPNLRENLPAGDYTIKVALITNPSCEETQTIVVPGDDAVSYITDSNITAASCGLENGTVEILVAEDLSLYTYTYEPNAGTEGATPNLRANLPAGTYTVTVALISNPICEEIQTIVVPEDAAVSYIIDSNISTASCGLANGTVELAVEGDPTLYTYSYEPNEGTVGATPNLRANLPAGTYTLRVALASNPSCEETQTIVVPEDATVSYITDSNITPASCGLENGIVELQVTGDPTLYTYSYAPEVGTAGATPNVQTNVPAGTYTLRVSLTSNPICGETQTIVVPEQGDITIVSGNNITPASCGIDNGMIEILVDGAIEDYTFTYLPNEGIAGITPNIQTDLPAGNYNITIAHNENDCNEMIDLVVPEDSAPLVLDTIIRPSDCNSSNGSVEVIVDGDLTNYSFTYDPNLGTIGASTNIMESLPAGDYSVTVRLNGAGTCNQIVNFTITEPEADFVNNTIVNPADCGSTNGSITLEVNGAITDYTYAWPSDAGIAGAQANSRTELSIGTYSVTVTPIADPTCGQIIEVGVPFGNTNASPVVDNVVTNPTCGLDNGMVNLTLVSDPSNYRFDWQPNVGIFGNTQNIRTDLPSGDYQIVITDLRDTVCVTSVSVNLVNEELVANAITNPSSCSGSEDGSIRLSPTTYTYTWEDGFIGSERFNILAGDYLVTITDPATANCTSPFTITLLTDNVFSAAAMIDSQPSCELNDGAVSISLEGGSGDYTYSWESLTNSNTSLSPGIYAVTISDNISACEAVVDFALADPQLAGLCDIDCDLSVGVDTIATQTIACAELNEICFDYPLDNDNLLQLSIDGFAVPIDTNDLCQTDMGTTGFSTLIDIGRHEAILVDPNTGCSDSILVMINCVFTDTTDIIFVPGEQDTICFSTEELTGGVASITVGCLQNDIASVEVVNDTCVVVEGLEPGIDTACVIICDSFGICDTTYLGIFVETLEYVDSLVVKGVGETCIDASALGSLGEISDIEIQQMITDSIKPVVSYEVDTVNNCIIYTGNVIGMDTTLVIFCDDANVCDTIPFMINVVNDEPDRLQDTLFINETMIYCFDEEIFPGSITTFENICLEQSGEHVDFFLNPLTNCVEYTGVDLGRDTACVILCDSEGNCDTAYFDALVVEFKELPTAIDDIDTTTIGTPVVIDILSNDTPFGVLEDGISIVEPPLYGEANLNLDGSVTYISDEFCARFDEFTYSICNAIGCDTAVAKVWIECIDIVIFTAVSPNRDTYNDFFFISGIEEFPESRLQIYNRWGERVYDVIGYDNDWAGTWKGNKELPDGAYFYCLELNDEDNRVFTGFLELHR